MVGQTETQHKTVGIIGGGGAIGRVVDRYLHELNYTTLICDVNLSDSLSLDDLLDRCRIVYISVFPLEAVIDILEHIADRPDAAEFVILENSSIKSMLVDPLTRLAEQGASICATHPLCKADQPWKNQNVLLIPFGRRSGSAEQIARQLYGHAQMKIKVVDSLTEHDELMAVLQLIPHLTLRVVSTVFAELGLDLDLLNSAATANFKLFYLSFWRVLVQSPALSASIIWQLLQQEKGREIFNQLMTALNEVHQQDLETLAAEFATFYKLPQTTPAYIEKMNLQGIVTLERLANLDRRALSIVARSDRVGLLREILRPFEELNININAIDSHMLGPDHMRFDIGYDPVDDETIVELRRRIVDGMGHRLIVEQKGIPL